MLFLWVRNGTKGCEGCTVIISNLTCSNMTSHPCQVMMAIDIDGIGVWGADSIVGEDDGGITEGDADLRLMLCILVVLAFMLALGLNVYRDPRIRALTGLAHAKNPALDTE